MCQWSFKYFAGYAWAFGSTNICSSLWPPSLSTCLRDWIHWVRDFSHIKNRKTLKSFMGIEFNPKILTIIYHLLWPGRRMQGDNRMEICSGVVTGAAIVCQSYLFIFRCICIICFAADWKSRCICIIFCCRLKESRNKSFNLL